MDGIVLVVPKLSIEGGHLPIRILSKFVLRLVDCGAALPEISSLGDAARWLVIGHKAVRVVVVGISSEYVLKPVCFLNV